jgi:hypothetical protein
LRPLRHAAIVVGVGALAACLTLAAPVYVSVPPALFVAGAIGALVVMAGGVVAYFATRPPARDAVWPRA